VRVFLDTNVLVSAFATRGLCADLLELVIAEHDWIIGTAVLRELEKALREKIKAPAARVLEISDFVAGEVSVLVKHALPTDAKIDADDAVVLGQALEGRAELFVTGDAALLKLGEIGGLQIVSPRQFWEALQKRR